MVKRNNNWGTVCDDNFEQIDAQAACITLGFTSLRSFKTYNSGYSESVPTLMDDVACPTNTTDFLQCTIVDEENCGHSEDVLLSCN